MKELLDKQSVLKAIDEEPEYPGEAPPKLMESIRQVLALDTPEQGVLMIARLAVAQTKRCIAERINTLEAVQKEGAE